jgi:hypothetical protein
MAVKSGFLSQFGLSTMMIYYPTLEFVPSGPGIAGEYVLASRPVRAELASDGSFTVTLIPSDQVTPETWYTMRITWMDEASNFTSLDVPQWRFTVTNVNGPLMDDAQTGTPTGLQVWVGTENNPAYRFWYHPVTADLRSNP